jgi:inositol-pentakisphosphate 2-kinase
MATTTTISVTDTLPQEWRYLSEGGATIVFRYVGPPNPRFNDMVLRLRKSTERNTLDPTGEDQQKMDEPDDPSIEFQKKCMERLLPSEHLPRLESAFVGYRWLKALATLHDAERPLERREKDHIDLSRTKGVLATDLVGNEWVAVEIKVCLLVIVSRNQLKCVLSE